MFKPIYMVVSKRIDEPLEYYIPSHNSCDVWQSVGLLKIESTVFPAVRCRNGRVVVFARRNRPYGLDNNTPLLVVERNFIIEVPYAGPFNTVLFYLLVYAIPVMFGHRSGNQVLERLPRVLKRLSGVKRHWVPADRIDAFMVRFIDVAVDVVTYSNSVIVVDVATPSNVVRYLFYPAEDRGVLMFEASAELVDKLENLFVEENEDAELGEVFEALFR